MFGLLSAAWADAGARVPHSASSSMFLGFILFGYFSSTTTSSIVPVNLKGSW
jgi:hypothetical protein